MEATVRERLVNLEQQSLLALLSRDEEALEEISQEWSQLLNDIKASQAIGKLDDKTALLFSQVSGSIESVASCMLQSQTILRDAQSHLINHINHEIPPNVLETPSHPPQITPYHLLFSHHPSSVQATLGKHKELDAYAYCWLMQNLHNPYPTTMQMQDLGKISGTSTAQVEIWFKEMRDAIGWTKLSRELFAGSPDATVAAARRVYLERDNDVPFGVVFAFTAAKAFAETHFVEHPALQKKSVEDLDLSRILPHMPEVQDHYFESEGCEESEEEDTTPPPLVAGCKRQLTEDILTLEDSDLGRPSKRCRTWPVIEGAFVAIRTMATDRNHHMGSFMGEPTLDPEGILVPPEVDCLAFLDPLSDLSDSDGSKEDDTTPSVFGCKRPLAEDVLTSQAASLGRPQKRHPTWSIYRSPSSETECRSPLPSAFGLSSEQAITYISAAPVSSFPTLHPLSPTSPESSPNPPPSISQNKGYMENTPEGAVGSIHTDVSVHGIRKRRLSQCVPPAPSKRQRRLSTSATNSTSSSDECRGRPTDPDEFLQSMPQVPVDSDIPVNLAVYDWNSIPDPLAGMASSISQLAEVYVPSSDLASQLLEPPDPGHDAKFTSNSFNDLGSLENLGSLLQFPMPAGRPPELSTSFSALPHSGGSSHLLQDWSTIIELINLFPPGSTQSSSPLISSSDPSPPENSYESLPLLQSYDTSEQLLSELDSSIPPSVFLPLGSGAFTEDVDNMCSLF